jgi:hypothetical protein
MKKTVFVFDRAVKAKLKDCASLRKLIPLAFQAVGFLTQFQGESLLLDAPKIVHQHSWDNLLSAGGVHYENTCTAMNQCTRINAVFKLVPGMNYFLVSEDTLIVEIDLCEGRKVIVSYSTTISEAHGFALASWGH